MLRWLFFACVLAMSSPAFGAVQCQGIDDTAGIQAAIDAGPIIELPEGQCAIRSLNITNKQSLIIRGQGREKTYLLAIENGSVVLDLTGSRGIQLRDFQLGRYNDTIVPAVGILTAQKEGSIASAELHFNNIYVSGSYSVATWYNLGVDSSSVLHSQFYNYINGIGTVVFISQNWPGVTSPFQTISTASYEPSDWSLFQVEIHNMSQTASAQTGGWGLWMGGADSIRFFGGNISGQSPDGWVSMNLTGGFANTNILFSGTTFYSDLGVSVPCALQGGQYVNGLVMQANSHPGASSLVC